ncbi:UbiB domain and Protein kinase-like domain-containing protein [Strongyloides ratti]|uniref:UbiB domain and Protein kinase-like domain-containing protein n=1 Tax=Strongyloides ratti TaxID=34506 RepID=A0A090LFX0_STRRB|nr:UbiB domain and Protein kinase-like domain-containing protein [Strongyloides ratti]CEF68671.1 UbiB domain and Protein kinase-like domain-containing protein [Strongyloides ratti]
MAWNGKKCIKEINQISKTLQFLIESQCPYEVKQLSNTVKDKTLQTIVMGGNVVRPFDSNKKRNDESMVDDILSRASVVKEGIDIFKSLAVKGIFPGDGGYIKNELEENEKIKTHDYHSNKNQIIQRKDESGLKEEEKTFLIKEASLMGNVVSNDPFVKLEIKNIESKKDFVYKPRIPKNYDLSINQDFNSLSKHGSGKTVPSTRIGRLVNFGFLGIGLASGAAAELTRRSFGINKIKSNDSVTDGNLFLTSSNAERIVQTLCRVRGAALKLGQMLSLQDEEIISKPLLDIFQRVRDKADFMPVKQVHKVMKREFGNDWRDLFLEFNEKPFAAASIGQVHKGVTKDGKNVAIKIQYPGVADGIDSDIDNLISILSFGGLFPKGMFLENFVDVARRELKLECDYIRELKAMEKFRELIGDSEDFYVPKAFPELSTKTVLTAELIEGKPVDMCKDEIQEVRDYIAEKFIEICLKEIFVWRFMQTDPNWSNFYLGKHPVTGQPRMVLLDFGASRSYSKKFTDLYMRIIKAAYDNDREKTLKYSREIGFLTGYESETLASQKPYDFNKQSVTKRIHALIPVMLEHRLTSPPEEIYSLHRKLSGSYLLATRLKATVSCGHLFTDIYKNYIFGDDGSKDIDIDSA